MTLNPIARLALPLLLLASPAFTQNGAVNPQLRRGPASSLPAGLSLERTDPYNNPDRNLAKREGDQANEPPTLPAGTKYALETLFPADYNWVFVDAHSTGNDQIPELDNLGRPALSSAQRWLGTVVSVTNSTSSPAGSEDLIDRRMRGQLGGRTTPGADLIAYYFDSSVGIDPTLAGSTILEQSSEHIGFEFAAEPNTEVDALDYAMGVLIYSTTVPQVIFRVRDQFYFSVSQESADLLNGSYPTAQLTGAGRFAVDNLGVGVLVHPGTIYSMAWDFLPAQGGGFENRWTTPMEYRTASHLGIDGTHGTPAALYDIDAIAVDPNTAVTVFSVRRPVAGMLASPLSQLMINGGSFGDNHTFMNEAGDPVEEEVGSTDTTRDVDAVCIIDPEQRNYDSHLGIPGDHILLPGWTTEPMGLSITRYDDPAGEMVLLQGTGWGGATPGPGSVFVALSLDHDPNAFFANYNWTFVGPIQRTIDMDSFELRVPALLGGAIQGKVGFAWMLYANEQTFEVGSSWVSGFAY